ncbi:MAG: sulfur carrier protein ThiS [Planctomycetes bacterium]|nr:sulfur carrier protein ThiS [Planctomycetota bacterium]
MALQITLNGMRETVEENMTVAALLRRRELEPIRVAVEINEDLVPRRKFPETVIHDGDRIEIVTFVGGG